MVINLYKHQEEQIKETAQAFTDGKQSILYQSPTGSGKSIVTAYIIRGALSKGKRIWLVVPRSDLLKQSTMLCNGFNIKYTFIASGFHHYFDNNLSLCMLETLRRNLPSKTGLTRQYRKPDLIIIDEAHFSGKAIGEITDYALNNGVKILGLSATPVRNDNTGMGDWFEYMTLGKSIRWLINNGFLAEYKIVQPEKRSLNNVGNPVELYKNYLMGRRTITFCKDIAHSKKIAETFVKNGIKAAHIDGTADIFQRRDTFIALAEGRLDTIVNSKLLNFGFDLEMITGKKNIPIEGMLDLAKRGSLPAQMQVNGRALRRQEGYSVIVDSAGNSLDDAHGLPCSDRQWILMTGNAAKRDKELRARKISSILCRNCGRPQPFTGKTHCAFCGEEFVYDKAKIKYVDGKLIEITPEMIKQEKKKQQDEKNKRIKRRNILLGRAKTIKDLKDIADEFGYKKGWVYAIAKAKKIRK